MLTYPEYVIFKGIDTIIDEIRIHLDLKLNVYVPPFNPKTFLQTIDIPNNITSYNYMKWSSAKNLQEKITKSTDQNNTLQDNKQHNESTKPEEQ